MEYAISVEGLRKRYGEREVLSGVSLSVAAGSVFGLLGPNGAGKTTIVRTLATLLDIEEGKATVAGFDVARQGAEVRKRIGLTGQYAAVDARLTGRENLVLLGTLAHLGRQRARQRAEELLEVFDLQEAANRLVGTYSGGMRRRLDLGASLIAEPEVIFLDEPTTGLDLISRTALWNMVRTQAEAGVTVLLTTQYLEEADQLADRVAVIDQGQVMAEGTPTELKNKVGGERLEITVETAELAQRALVPLAAVGVAAPIVDSTGLRISVALDAGTGGIADAATGLQRAGIAVADFSVRRPSLDDVFLQLTGHRTEDTTVAAAGRTER
ncbi:ATP-binding cassette domain-containing protein [Actinoplanes sp. LDG1-06]|uniref:ATP-binding cassette domain-containing protein n=1 Tax=Paractinoplanes ovalisporus TaxID=2810368 RepID=A0ABS2AI38_9ACTN|nr:ATP-binding cassette domain-containing protein [Actinoplanes ovalisporus]MBM2619514.1 ATP-binding cassette domain-containing protein [Actinoplanes ovalisporus]